MVTAESGNGAALALPAGLDRLLVGAHDVRAGVHGGEAKRLGAGVADRMWLVSGDQRHAAALEQPALVADLDLGPAVHHHDRLLGAVGVAGQMAARVDLEHRRPARDRTGAGPQRRSTAPARRALAFDPGVAELQALEVHGSHALPFARAGPASRLGSGAWTSGSPARRWPPRRSRSCCSRCCWWPSRSPRGSSAT